MEKYYYYSAQIFNRECSGLVGISTGTTISSTGCFPIKGLMASLAETNHVPILRVAITFFTEISKEEYDAFNDIEGVKKD